MEIIWQKALPSDSVFVFGRCIASGDVNGDCFSDIVIVGDSVIESPPHSDSCYRGRCWIFLGGTNLDTIPDICLNNLQKLTFFALHSDDVNGDGFDDVILGACNNASGYGEVLIFLGGNPMDTICDYKIRGPHSGSGFGGAIGSGDVNGDSYEDLIIGACGAAPMPGGYMMGRVYIYFGSPNFDTIPDVILNGGHDGDYECFGATVGGGGDINSDGFRDVIIGAYQYGTSTWGDGRIYIYLGGNPMDTIFDVAMIGEYPNQNLGLAGLGFITNSFDYDYAVFGDPFWPQGLADRGKVYVLFGGNPMDSIPDVWMIGRTDTSRLGTSTTSAGDLNLDNCDDIISGAPLEGHLKGASYVWLGGVLLDTMPDAWIKGVQYDDDIGRHVASAGDVDGDGGDEIMISNSASDYTPKRVWVCKYTDTGIEGRPHIINRLPLEVRPNPVKTQTSIRYSLSAESRISLSIYDIAGKLVKTIENQDNMLKPGNYEARWYLRSNNKKRVSSGIYFLEMTVKQKGSEEKVGFREQETREIRKITVVK